MSDINKENEIDELLPPKYMTDENEYGEPKCLVKESEFCQKKCKQRNSPLGCFCLY